MVDPVNGHRLPGLIHHLIDDRAVYPVHYCGRASLDGSLEKGHGKGVVGGQSLCEGPLETLGEALNRRKTQTLGQVEGGKG
jgi:hypothetical protein